MASSLSNKTLLLVLGVGFLPYGLYCFFAPDFLASAAGVAATTPTGNTELRAMYGGLQAGFGVLLLAAVRDTRLQLAALAALAFLVLGLAVSRLLGAFFDGGLSGYTIGALIFEFGTSAVVVPRFVRALQAVRV